MATRLATLTNEQFYAAMNVKAPPTPTPEIQVRHVYLTSEPRNLNTESIIRKAINRGDVIQFVERPDAELILSIKAYNFDYSDSGSQTETVSLAKYQVENFMGAFILMSESSSYNVDINTQRGVGAYEVAYSIK